MKVQCDAKQSDHISYGICAAFRIKIELQIPWNDEKVILVISMVAKVGNVW